MNSIKYLVFILPLILSCRAQSHSDRGYTDGDENKVYRLRLNPLGGTKYDYDFSNQSEFKLDVDGKKVDNSNNTEAGISYFIAKDSSGDLILHMQYSKIRLHSKTGDNESNMDATNAAISTDPTERMLGFVKDAKITAVLSPVGEVKSMTGAKEIIGRFMDQLSVGDASTRKVVQEKWNTLVDGNLIAGNMQQLFRIFPDSGVRVGDKWKLTSRQKDEFALKEKNDYRLTAIHEGVAYIESEGEITSDSSVITMMGYQVVPDLKGKQHGDYQMEMSTGMLLSATITNSVEGTIQVQARDIPVTIENSVRIKRK